MLGRRGVCARAAGGNGSRPRLSTRWRSTWDRWEGDVRPKSTLDLGYCTLHCCCWASGRYVLRQLSAPLVVAIVAQAAGEQFSPPGGSAEHTALYCTVMPSTVRVQVPTPALSQAEPLVGNKRFTRLDEGTGLGSVARGAFGKVYIGIDKVRGTTVAVKRQETPSTSAAAELAFYKALSQYCTRTPTSYHSWTTSL